MNSKELQKQWDEICTYIKGLENIDSAQINAIFSRLHLQAMSPGFLMLTTDSDFMKAWIEYHYMETLKSALNDMFHVPFSVLIEVDSTEDEDIENKEKDTQVRPAQITSPIHQSTPEKNYSQLDSSQGDFLFQPDNSNNSEILDKKTNNEEIEDFSNTTSTQQSAYTFENFVIGDSNRMAYSTAVAVAETPGKSHLNPLFIYGKSGLGKTHLMCAIQHYIKENLPQLKCIYVDSHEFLNEYTEACIQHDKQKTSYKNFREKYINADVLLIDDVQFFQGKTQTLDIVFQIFNQLTNQGKQIVLSADRAPKNIDIDERYKSRFNQGGTFDIQPPEVETKLGIVRSFIEAYKKEDPDSDFSLSPEIQLYIAENSSSNIRELKAAITKVICQITAFGNKDISLDEVKKLLENHYSGGPTKRLTVMDIQKEVESYYKVSHTDLVGKKRTRDITYARQVALYLCREMIDLPYNDIGKKFNRDHSTVMYSVDIIEEKMKESREVREEIESLKQMIREA